MSFAEKLQKYRKDMGLSQEEMAERLGVSRQSVSKWELDQAYPETNKLIELSRLLNVTVDELLKDEQPAPLKKHRAATVAALAVILAFLLSAVLFVPREKGSEAIDPTEPEMGDLRRFYFDFAREYRLDYVPYFERGQEPADSTEYLYFAFAVNLDNWGEEKGTMTKEYVDETVSAYFGAGNITHRSQPKSWDYDGEKYTAWPEGIKPLPVCVLTELRTWEEDGKQVYEVTLDFCEADSELGEEELRQRVFDGDMSGMTVTGRETFVYTPSRLNFDKPLFLSHTAGEQ